MSTQQPTTGTEIRLASRPSGWPTAENFEIAQTAVPSPGPGEVLVRNRVMSVDPYMRGRMNDAKSYVAPFQLGAPLEGAAVGEVVASEASSLPVGQLVTHNLGWREYAALEAAEATPVDADLAHPSAFLGVLGMPGLTAYAGLLRVGRFQPGDTVFVSGAAGAVGSLVGQLAKLRGAGRVVGSAGSAEKVRHLTEDLGFDAAFNYKDGPVRQQLAEAAPDGIDLYFDNVGGEHLEAAIGALGVHGRAVECGMISGYNSTEPQPAPRNLMQVVGKRLRIEGMLVADHADLQPEFHREMAGHLDRGELRFEETTVEGLTNAPQAFLDMMAGANTGKMLVTV